MFKAGIQYLNVIDKQAVAESIFNEFQEIRIAESNDIFKEDKDMHIKGAVWNPIIDGDITELLLERLSSAGCIYIVLETKSIKDGRKLMELLDDNIGRMQMYGMTLLIENSNIEQKGSYIYGPFSEGYKLCTLVENIRSTYNYDNVGICADIGVANLLGSNLKAFIEDCMPYLVLVHVNDNDGYKDMAQMPFTFTVGRGARATDIYRVIGTLIKYDFNGFMVFNNAGTWKRTPDVLHHSMVRLLEGIVSEWEKEFGFTDKLGQQGKHLILFGAGNMFRDYMISFGEKYPPEFIVDNNKEVWGEERLGVEIKSPDAILEIPPEERNVWICNMNYGPIGKQLKSMGVEYDCFIDQYYI